jgi:hypothetical protein
MNGVHSAAALVRSLYQQAPLYFQLDHASPFWIITRPSLLTHRRIQAVACDDPYQSLAAKAKIS